MPTLLLDGGTGHELKLRGVDQFTDSRTRTAFEDLGVAGALANEMAPELVTAVHHEFIEAGADVITANNFCCTEWCLSKAGKAGFSLELTAVAAKLARDAAAGAARPVLVAGSLPPLRESYQVEGLLAFEEMETEYRGLVGALLPHVDLLLCETLSTTTEGLAAGSAASASGLPWWLSYTIEDSEEGEPRLRSGEPLEDAVRAVAELPGLEVVLVNCCAPRAATAALPTLRAAAPAGAGIGAYANGFEVPTGEWLAGGSGSRAARCMPRAEYDDHGVITPEAYAVHAHAWVDVHGAGVAGGCCAVGPRHIAALRALIDGRQGRA